jgi:hypothetical protein
VSSENETYVRPELTFVHDPCWLCEMHVPCGFGTERNVDDLCNQTLDVARLCHPDQLRLPNQLCLTKSSRPIRSSKHRLARFMTRPSMTLRRTSDTNPSFLGVFPACIYIMGNCLRLFL